MIGAEAADRARRGADDRRRLLVPHAAPIGPGADVDRVLKDPGDTAIIFGRAEQDSVCRGYLLTEPDVGLWLLTLKIVVLAIQRQVADIDHPAFQLVAAQGTDRARDLAVDAVFPEAADDDRDL